jgi:hypothetical protein
MFKDSKILPRYRLLWYALNGALLGGSMAFSFSFDWFNDPLDHWLTMIEFQWLTAIIFQWLLATPFIWFGIIWGLVHGLYRGLDGISRDPLIVGGNPRTAENLRVYCICAGLISFLMVCGYILEYHFWIFLHGMRYRNWFDAYYWGLCCVLFSAMGLTFARHNWLRTLFFLLTLALAIWIFGNPYFPWRFG